MLALDRYYDRQFWEGCINNKDSLLYNLSSFFIISPIVATFVIVYAKINGNPFYIGDVFPNKLLYIFIFLALILLCLMIHELIHGLLMGIFAKNHFKAISYGYSGKNFTLLCKCSDELTLIQDLISRLMPLFILGIIPGIISIIFQKTFLFQLSIVMIFSAAGDFLTSIILIYQKFKKIIN